MFDFIYYEAKVAVLMAVFYICYRLLLEKQTLHRLNRMVLLGTATLSFVLPFCVLHFSETVIVDKTLSGIAQAPSSVLFSSDSSLMSADTLSLPWLTGIVVLSGIIAKLFHTVWEILYLRKMIGKAEKTKLEDGIKMAVVHKDVSPFSWFNTIVLSRTDYARQSTILIAHERAHIKLLHSYDMLWVELIIALQWFNPVAWMLRKDIKTIHEYEADQAVLQKGFNRREYLAVLIESASRMRVCQLTNALNNSTIKKRVLMMGHQKTPNHLWMKALYIVPIIVLSLTASAETEIKYKVREMPGHVEERNLSIPGHTLKKSATGKNTHQDKETTSKNISKTNGPYLDQIPEYPGGFEAFNAFLESNAKNPPQARENTGKRKVTIKFTIEKDGRASHITVLESEDPSLSAEVVRVVQLAKRWKPALKNGKPVPVQFVTSVVFTPD
ncbi:MAG: M56 family metallopeptidase [Prevotellaceae bacterium]|nr:M56 family metallopeptidase [Prevotellaceae bacterium]MDY6130739.1 M56 family metallopeptidase [Prevotella sp.]